jgi:hypothetical protein
MSTEILPGLRIADGVYARVHALARELNLPADATRSQLITALARSRATVPSLPVAYDDTRDLEDVLRVIPSEGLKVAPQVGWRAVAPRVPQVKPEYTIRVRAVMCADSDGSHAANISEATLKDVLKAMSTLYFQAGLKFVLSEREVLANTVINQDFTVPSRLNMTTSTPPMTDKARDKSFDEHNAARSAWARNHPGELVVFFRYGTKLIWNEAKKVWTVGPSSFAFSGPEHEFVAMGQANPPESVLLAHESGHYFHLGHTHGGLVSLTDAERAKFPDWEHNPDHRQAGAKILRDRLVEGIRKFVDDQGHSPDSGLDVLNADGLSDTRPDPGPTIFAYEFGAPCDSGTITVQVNLTSGVRKYDVVGSPEIIMSYFFRCPGIKRYSQLQINRIRHVVETPVLTGTVTTAGGTTLPILSRHHLIVPKLKPGLGPVVMSTPPVRRRGR